MKWRDNVYVYGKTETPFKFNLQFCTVFGDIRILFCQLSRSMRWQLFLDSEYQYFPHHTIAANEDSEASLWPLKRYALKNMLEVMNLIKDNERTNKWILENSVFLPGEDAEYANCGWAPPWLCAPLIPEKDDGRSSPANPPTPSIPLPPSWGAAGLWYRRWTGSSTEVILSFS